MSCELFIINKKVESNGLINTFVNLAQSQRNAFVDIFPWDSAKGQDLLMIVAATDMMSLRACRNRTVTKIPRQTTKICGWLTAIVFNDSVYLSEISSRSATNSNVAYKGIGKRMFDKLVEWCVKNKKDYIYLYPLNERVKDLYESKWGLTPVEFTNAVTHQTKKSKRLFYKLRALPAQSKVATMENTAEFSEDEFDIIQDELSKSQIIFMNKLKSTNKDAYEQIMRSIESLISLCEDEDDQQQHIKDYFEEVMQQYGQNTNINAMNTRQNSRRNSRQNTKNNAMNTT